MSGELFVYVLFAGGLISAGILVVVSVGGIIKAISTMLGGKKETSKSYTTSGV
ncbi:hypothetical protein [Geoglobus acetivorans]|uniref:Uncharacterized protein n=1 Tax=Geoglobus acetivorans TaxID=565033 RepID=A0ABZ3H2B3_GEOAI|nr:hypothetical protein [Geoglobus acetivorans]